MQLVISSREVLGMTCMQHVVSAMVQCFKQDYEKRFFIMRMLQQRTTLIRRICEVMRIVRK